MRSMLAHDLKQMARSGGSWIFGLVFFLFFIALCAVALGGRMEALKVISIPLIWLAIFFSTQLSIGQIFRADMEDGTMQQVRLSPNGLPRLTTTRLLSFGLFTLLPLIALTPVGGAMTGLDGTAQTGLIGALLLAAPALSIYTVLTGALLCARSGGGFLGILLSAPLLLPILIFGVGAAQAFPDQGWAALEFRILAGLSFIAVAIGWPAILAALTAQTE